MNEKSSYIKRALSSALLFSAYAKYFEKKKTKQNHCLPPDRYMCVSDGRKW